MANNKDKITLFRIIKTVGLRNLLFNFGSIFSVLFILGFIYLYISKKINIGETVVYVSNTIASVSGTVLGIVIAGLAIILAILNSSILERLEKSGDLNRILYPFSLASFSWCISLISCLILHLLSSFDQIILVIMLCIEFAFFNFALYCTLDLINSTIRIIKIIAKTK